ncbi:MAG: hypothetical protein P4M14_07960 [Gammaproteobacteria bacterium]|nr:hypothetical protein [Gammaproteobacteria bacterium]
MFMNIRLFCASVLFVSLAGCSHLYGEQGIIKNRDSEYLNAQTIPPLNLPAGYSSTSLQENYPVPIKHYSESEKRVDLTPPELNTTGK